MRASAVMAIRPGAVRRVRSASRPPWRARPMARPRRLAGRTGLLAAGAALAVTAAMAMLVGMGNEVVNLRRDRGSLRVERECEEARLAILQAEWAAATAPAVVVAAGLQLGLVQPEAPALVVVLDVEQAPPGGRLRRVVDGLGEGVAAVNAQDRRP